MRHTQRDSETQRKRDIETQRDRSGHRDRDTEGDRLQSCVWFWWVPGETLPKLYMVAEAEASVRWKRSCEQSLGQEGTPGTHSNAWGSSAEDAQLGWGGLGRM